MLSVMLPTANPTDIANQRRLARLRRSAGRAAIANPRSAGPPQVVPVITDNGATNPAITAATSYPCNFASRGVWHLVGGRYVSLGGTVPGTTSGNTDQYLALDFGARAVRRITIEATRTGKLAGGFVEDGAALWPVDVSDVPHAVFLGDSYVFGSGPDLTADGVAVQMADRMGLALQASGSGGTGWNQTATNVLRFDQRIAGGDLGLGYHVPEVIFLHASVNDAYPAQNYAAVQAHALAGLRAARAQFHGVPIVVFGCIAAPNRVAAQVTACEAAMAGAVGAFGDPLCRFVPIDGDPGGKWITGLGSEIRFTAPLVGANGGTLTAGWPAGTSATSYTIVFSDGSTRLASLVQNGTAVTWSGAVTAGAVAMVRQIEGNARFTIGADWVHPTAYGAAYIGERYARGALAALESMLG